MSINPELGVYLYTQVNFFFDRGGYIVANHRILAEGYDLYKDGWWIVILDLIWLFLLLRLFVQELIELKFFQRLFHVCCLCSKESRTYAYWADLSEYFGDVWNVLDWSSIFVGFQILRNLWGLNDELVTLGRLFHPAIALPENTVA